MGQVVMSKTAVVTYVVIAAVLITAVGLMAGLLPDRGGSTATDQPNTQVPTTTQATTTIKPVPGPWDSIRLPTDLHPVYYKVDLKPILSADSNGDYWFTGSSEVTFLVVEPTKYIYIHSKALEYDKVAVENNENEEVKLVRYEIYLPYEYLIVEMEVNMEVGQNYTLKTSFKGELTNSLGGLYRSSYEDENGNLKVIATTQMQPTDARKAFPCFDEPQMKAVFEISLWHKDPMYAISNMPVVLVTDMDEDWKKSDFEPTFPMSTYLLAFVVCDFDSVEGFTNTSNNVTSTIYARKDQVDAGNADYANEITPKILKFYQEYFDVLYPLPKADQLAVPDFNAGAMENWGLVIYRETALLYNNRINSASNKQRVATVVAHELAHQWFGNLITPEWWNELWLNEGFASYLEYLGTDSVEPDWQMENQFVVLDLQRALDVDALTSSHPIVQKVETPAEINEVFDTISYSKGACLIRMINSYAGDESFKLGLTNYLNANKYGSVVHQELFAAWEEVILAENNTLQPSNGLQDALSTWTLQMGFPVITLKRTSDDLVEVTQKRFLVDGKADPELPPSPFNYRWDIPFWYQTNEDDEKLLIWLQRDQQNVEISITSSVDWLLGNSEARGYYRVNYDDDSWQRIIAQLNTDYTKISASSRGQLINDAFTLARAGLVHYNVSLALTEFLSSDNDFSCWESALNSLSYFDLTLARSSLYGSYNKYLLDISSNLYEMLGWDEGASDSILDQYQRVNAISINCYRGNRDCVEVAQTRFNEWYNLPEQNNIPPNLKTVVYCTAVQFGTELEWNFIFERYLNEKNSQEKSKLQTGLTCSTQPWINRRLLDYTADESYVRKQDALSILEGLCYNDYARDIVWDYIRANWDLFYERYGGSSFSFSGLITSCTSHFSTEFELTELQNFIDTNLQKLGSAKRAADQAVEQTQANIEWRANYETEVGLWLTASGH